MRIHKSLAVRTDKESGAVTLEFYDENDQAQSVHIPPQAADFLLLGMLSAPYSYLADGRTSSSRAPLLATGCLPLKYDNGYKGLAFSVSEKAAFQVAFPKEAIPSIRTALDNLMSDDILKKH